MLRAKLMLVLLLTGCFTLATCLQSQQPVRAASGGSSGNALVLLLGDARKMFASQMFAKADAYFHRGNYPSIFDQTPRHEENHMAGETQHHDEHGDADHDDDHDEAPAPAHDWIEDFGRHFFPTTHVHLQEGEEREMLPWLRASAELDPQRIETYTVAAYWLQERLNKVDEAEAFLRDGLRANPNSPELLYDLGRLLGKKRQDNVRAKNLWVFALRRWHEVEEPKPKPNQLLELEILGGLAHLELEASHFDRAIDYLNQLKAISPSPEIIQKQIDALAAKAAATKQ